MARQFKSLEPFAAESSEADQPLPSVWPEDCIRFIHLNVEWLDSVETIEHRCYHSPWSRNLLRRELEREEFSFAPGLLVDERLVGYSFNYIVADELHILNVAVDPLYRGVGFGRRILTHVMHESLNRGVTRAALEVRASNSAAQNLYSSMGFRFSGVRREYYNDNREDAMVLERELSPTDREPFRVLLGYR